MENKNILTDEQVEMISEALEEERNEQKGIEENFRKIQEATNEEKEEMLGMCKEDGDGIPYNVINKNLYKTQAMVEINPATGEKTILHNSNKVNNKATENISIEDMLDITDEDISKADIELSELQDDVLKNTAKELADLSDKEAFDMLQLIKKSDKGMEVTIDELPTKIALLVDTLRVAPDGTKRSRKSVIKDLLHFIKNQAQTDQEIINLQETLQKEMNIPSLMGIYNEETDKMMTESISKLAEKARNEGNEEKAKQLDLMKETYLDAKNFTSINNAIDNNDKVARKLDREIKRFNKYIRDFNYKYQKNTKFTIDNLLNVIMILQRHTDCSEEQAKKFLIIFCRICMNKNSDNVIDHVYMYFTLKTITTLDAYKMEDQIYIEKIEQLCNILLKLK